MTLKEAIREVEAKQEFWVNEREFSDYYERVQDCPDEQLCADVDYITFDGNGTITFEI